MLSFLTATAATWYTWPGNDRLPSKEVYSIFVLADGSVHIGTDQGLYRADEMGKTLKHVPLVDRYGHDKGTVRYIDSTTVITLTDVYRQSGKEWKRSAEVTETDLYIREFTEPGGIQWKYNRRKPYLSRTVSGDTLYIPKELGGKIITDIISLGNARIAVATNNDGIYICNLRNGAVENLRHTTDDTGSLPRNHVMGIAFNSSTQMLYAAIPQAGVWTLQLATRQSELLKTGIEEEISSIVRDGKGRIWLSYDGGGIQILDRQMRPTEHFLQSTTDIPTDIITALYPIGDDAMLVSTYGKGVFEINKSGHWQQLPELDETSDAAQCRSIARDKNDNLWVATFTKGLVYRTADGTTKTFNTKNSALRTDYITDLKASPAGDSIFVATGFGLYAFDTGDLGSTNFSHQLKIRQMAFLSDGKLLLGTNSGIYDRYGKRIVLEGISIKAIAAGQNNDAWCVSDSALYHINANHQVKQIQIPSGLRFANYALSTAPNGELYAGSFGSLLIASADSAETAPEDTGSSKIWIILAVCFLLIILIVGITKFFGKKTVKEETPQEAVTNLSDKQWLESVVAIVDANYADANFGVEEFGQAMSMSRSNLYKRLTALTGKTPQEYLRDKRVEVGRRLLEQSRDSQIKPTLSEIAYKVGMSPRQFSKYLRENDK